MLTGKDRSKGNIGLLTWWLHRYFVTRTLVGSMLLEGHCLIMDRNVNQDDHWATRNIPEL